MSLDETTVSPRPPLEQFRLGAALLFFCAVIAYLPAINAGFIWDDDLLLTANPQMGSVRGLGEIWLGRNCCDYTPVTLTAFWLEHELWGDTATGYHVVNILLHALAAVLLWHNLSILRIRGSWLAALLFVIHPVNVASVAWIAELKNTLSAVFFFASILAFLISRERPSKLIYILSILLFALAGLCKGAVVVLPLVLCGCIAWKKERVTRHDLHHVMPFGLIAIAIALFTIHYQSRAPDYAVFAFDFPSRIARAGVVVWLDLLEVFWPIKLSPMFGQWQPNIRAGVVYVPTLLALAAFATFLWKAKSWGRSFLFASGYYLLMLLPVLGFVWMALQQEVSAADWWQYLAAPGIFAGVAAGFCTFSNRIKSGRLALHLLLCLALAVLLIQTWHREAIYQSMETYCRAVAAENPHAWTLQTNLGVVLAQRGEFEQAAAHHRQALRDNPRYMQAHNNLGNALRARGKVPEAEAEYRCALQLDSSNPIIWANLADFYLAGGKIREALSADAEAIRLDRNNPRRYTEYGIKLAANSQLEAAVVCFRNALILDPADVVNQIHLARALLATGHRGEASIVCDQAARSARESGNKELVRVIASLMSPK